MAAKFEISDIFLPAGDQPQAIEALVRGYRESGVNTMRTFWPPDVIAHTKLS